MDYAKLQKDCEAQVAQWRWATSLDIFVCSHSIRTLRPELRLEKNMKVSVPAPVLKAFKKHGWI